MLKQFRSEFYEIALNSDILESLFISKTVFKICIKVSN